MLIKIYFLKLVQDLSYTLLSLTSIFFVSIFTVCIHLWSIQCNLLFHSGFPSIVLSSLFPEELMQL